MIKTLLMIVSIAVSLTNAHFAAAQNISQSGDLTASSFDELGFDPTGLVGYWQLNGNAHDSSGLHLDGTIYGATSTTNRFGVVDGAMLFDGLDDYIDAGSSSLNDNAVTFCVWIKTADTLTESGVVTQGTGISLPGIALRIRQGVPGWSARKKDDSGYFDLFSGTNVMDNQWHHVVGTFDAVDGMKRYLDGYLEQSRSTGQPYLLSTVNLKIATGGHIVSRFFNGAIDEVKIFNRALSAGEVLAMYDHEKGKFSISQDGTNRALSFVEDSALPVQMRSKKESLTVRGSLIEN